MKTIYISLASIIIAGSSLAGDWYVEVGAVGRSNMKIDMSSDSYARMLNMQAAQAGRSMTMPMRSGSAPILEDDMGAGAREFRDGSVSPDALTVFFGDTGNWDFDAMSQYDAIAQSLTFHTASEAWMGSESGSKTAVSTTRSDMLQDDNNSNEFGLEAKVGYRFYEKGIISLAIQGSLRIFDESEETLRGTPFTQTIVNEQYRISRTMQENWSYVYDANFGGPELLAPRPEGTTTAPYLPVTPLTRNLDSVDDATEVILISRTFRQAQSDVRLDTQLQLTQLALGPTLELTFPHRIFIGISPYLTINILDFSATRTETFRFSSGSTIASWRDEEDETKVEFGAGLDAYIGYEFIDTWSAVATIGYEDSFDDICFAVGPGEVSADLSSKRYSLGIRHRF